MAFRLAEDLADRKVASICSLNRPSDRHTYCEGPRIARRGFEQQWTTAAAAEPMRESPVRYFTPEDCRLQPCDQRLLEVAGGDTLEVEVGINTSRLFDRRA